MIHETTDPFNKPIQKPLQLVGIGIFLWLTMVSFSVLFENLIINYSRFRAHFNVLADSISHLPDLLLRDTFDRNQKNDEYNTA